MAAQEHINYKRIETAITYIKEHFKEQPSLEEVATAVHLSPFHFQRLFTQWAGVSPKKFMQFLSVEHAKKLLKEQSTTLLDTAHDTGFSSTSRLHDLFINIESMTPGEYKNGGEELTINYSFTESPFGKMIIASTHIGVCHISFSENNDHALDDLKQRFPHADYCQRTDQSQQNALCFFQQDWQNLNQIKLHLTGTPFQLKVWDSLIKIPLGQLTTYGEIAQNIGSPKAARAVGTAIGSNPIAFLIPCHRVIQSSGKTGGYMWGADRKSAIIGWESAKIETKPC